MRLGLEVAAMALSGKTGAGSGRGRDCAESGFIVLVIRKG